VSGVEGESEMRKGCRQREMGMKIIQQGVESSMYHRHPCAQCCYITK